MSQLAENILSAARALPEGGLLSPKEFLHMGSRAAIDKTLSRLAQEGNLMRVSRGVYVAPHQGRFGSRPPSTESVIQAIEAGCGEAVVSSGAAEANALGLTTQVPTREVFFTSGSSRKLQLGSRCVELKHGNRWQGYSCAVVDGTGGRTGSAKATSLQTARIRMGSHAQRARHVAELDGESSQRGDGMDTIRLQNP